MIRCYKFRIYPSIQQAELLKQHLWLSKQIWNDLIAVVKQMYKDFGRFPTKSTLQSLTKEYKIYGQTKQNVSHRVYEAVMRYFKLKKKGIKVGFPRFKKFNKFKSLYYPQNGFYFEDKKLHATPFGEIQIKKYREIKGKIKTLTVKKEPSGKWFAIFTSEIEDSELKNNKGKIIGIDLGIHNLAILSDGKTITNPRYFNELEAKLAFQQRKFARKKLKSNNWKKNKLKVVLIYEKIANSRKDFLHKNSTELVNTYSLIVLEKLKVKNMVQNRYLSKAIKDVSWSMFTNMLSYKAESAGSKVVFVNPRNTSKECSQCHTIKTAEELPLKQRVYCCFKCGLNIDRDINAATNILNRTTLGQRERNASGVETQVSTKKEECMNDTMSLISSSCI